MINQLAFYPNKLVTLVKDDCGATFIRGEDKDIGIGAQGVESRTFRGAEAGLL